MHEFYGVFFMFPELIDPRALRLPIDQFVGDLVANYSSTLRAMTQPLLDMLVFMESILRSSPWSCWAGLPAAASCFPWPWEPCCLSSA
jgi:hypothetical protein